MSLWLSGASSTAVAVDVKYPPGAAPEEPERGLSYWLDYYRDLYETAAEVRRAAEAARDKAERDREAAEAARFRTQWATPPGRVSTRVVTAEQVAGLVERLREEAAWIDGRVELGPPDAAGQVIEVAFPAEVRPELIKGTLALALGPLGTDLDRLWSGIERLWARVRTAGGDITERRVQLLAPARGYELDQRHRVLVPVDQAREVLEARAALDRVIEQAKTGRDRERLEEVRELVRGARALQDVGEAQEAARKAEGRAAEERERERAAEERARQAEERAARAAREAEEARAEAARVQEEARDQARALGRELEQLERRVREAEQRRAEAERRADGEARERLLVEEAMARLREALGLPAPGAPRGAVPPLARESAPAVERKQVKKVAKKIKIKKAKVKKGKRRPT